MKKLLLLPTLMVLVILTTPTARADALQLVGAGTNTFGHYSAGPYSATLNGTPIAMMCVSFDRTVRVGQTWQVAVNTLDAAGVANSLYGAQADALLRYQRGAWLYDQLSAHPNQSGAIQGALWNIFNSGTPDTADSNSWTSLAMSANLTNYDFSRFRILTPSDRSASGPQENLTTVPEPATMLLLGSGLAGVAARARRRRRKIAKSKQE